ncbi:phosphoribosylanthranilate isomerase [Ahrensia sp. 13_GOM-1096m]|uniref:phosphoribosylanthranilate isomerase n=1 Tax=Ahrensia sp. 13_GOM-1096m TaxID=1380380 RepID=UPI00047BE684|nr:phosphoribosylanthranilate isomerase [Ahrensia sp. 13_GOM-1096m]
MDIKICGLSTIEATDAVIAGGATHVGFIFFPKSPRHVAVDTAAKLGARAQAQGLKSVAVTVNADDSYLDEIVAAMKPDILQLHGSESPERVTQVKARYGLPVMKAFAISTRDDLDKIDIYNGITDRFLFDAKAPKNSELPGGNGVSFDWTLLEGLDPSVDYMLSGGLNASNVSNAIANAKPSGLDISSGVESEPGVKSTKLIASFFEAVANAKKRETND